MEGLIGTKKGMTQVWDKAGNRIAVTVVEVGPCPVVQVKTLERDGYEAVQLGYGLQKASRMPKAEVARFEKAGIATPCRMTREFKADEGETVQPGDVLTAALFEGVAFVDVIGTSKGKGFAGVVRRYGFRGGPMTHGAHNKRRPGSIGMRQDPGSVRKGHKMSGHMGARRVTTQNLVLVDVRADDNLLLIAGAVPGPINGTVIVRKALKKKGVK